MGYERLNGEGVYKVHLREALRIALPIVAKALPKSL